MADIPRRQQASLHDWKSCWGFIIYWNSTTTLKEKKRKEKKRKEKKREAEDEKLDENKMLNDGRKHSTLNLIEFVFRPRKSRSGPQTWLGFTTGPSSGACLFQNQSRLSSCRGSGSMEWIKALVPVVETIIIIVLYGVCATCFCILPTCSSWISAAPP